MISIILIWKVWFRFLWVFYISDREQTYCLNKIQEGVMDEWSMSSVGSVSVKRDRIYHYRFTWNIWDLYDSVFVLNSNGTKLILKNFENIKQMPSSIIFKSVREGNILMWRNRLVLTHPIHQHLRCYSKYRQIMLLLIGNMLRIVTSLKRIQYT